MGMDTAEMRLLTVPQFARRVSRSVDEVLALIANRDVKALRPDPEGGYRVLETEVDRLLQERTTRIKPARPALPADSAGSAGSAGTGALEATPARMVAMEVHLTAVTALETVKQENARLERLNSTLQAELFQYRRLYEDEREELLESRSRLESAQQQLCAARLERIDWERQRVEIEQVSARRLQAELQAAQQAQSEKAAQRKTWWRRFFG
jgi:hypothetical protein